MSLSDRDLAKILAAESCDDRDEQLKLMAQEIRQLRIERRELSQVFVPLVGDDETRIKPFMADFQDLCMQHRIPAACMCIYLDADTPLGYGVHYGGAEGAVQLLMKTGNLPGKGNDDQTPNENENNSG